METTILRPGCAPEAMKQASRVMADYVRVFCGAAGAGLREHREFLVYCLPASASDATAYDARWLDRIEITRLIRRIGRIQGKPLPHARAELRRLVVLLERVPFDSLEVARDHLTLSHRPGAPGNGQCPFDICFPSAWSDYFPVFIRKITDKGEDILFTKTYRHGACRGEAEPILETAVERIALADLALITLSWARRNV